MTKRDREDRWERWVREALPGPHLRRPPASTLRKALALGSQLEPRTGAATWLVKLLFDSSAQPLPAGVRGGTAGHRRLLYQARTEPGEEVQLDLRVRRERGGTLELTGQLLPPWAGAQVVAFAGRGRRKLSMGDGGEFLAKRLSAGSEVLRLEIRAENGDELVIDDIPLPGKSTGVS